MKAFAGVYCILYTVVYKIWYKNNLLLSPTSPLLTAVHNEFLSLSYKCKVTILRIPFLIPLKIQFQLDRESGYSISSKRVCWWKIPKMKYYMRFKTVYLKQEFKKTF